MMVAKSDYVFIDCLFEPCLDVFDRVVNIKWFSEKTLERCHFKDHGYSTKHGP
jgi:hypothetical protein